MKNSFHIAARISEIEKKSLEPLGFKPLIGITGNFENNQLQLLSGYIRSIEAVGGIPIVIPPCKEPNESLIELLNRIDGLLLSGGADLNPLYVGEDPVPALHGINPIRDNFELVLIKLAYNRQMPILGICRGMQMLTVALGGKVVQDLQTAFPQASLIKHSQDAPRGVATHFVKSVPNSRIEKLFGEKIPVNSFHHQAVEEAGSCLRVTARSSDGVIEAVESTEMHPIIGVQWHPECFILENDTSMLPLFEYFVAEAFLFQKARNIHRSVLTLDSHCDTPMFFNQNVDLFQRDKKLLVDFPKMREGMLDASIMVAYIPQGERTEDGNKLATTKAINLLSEIELRVEKSPYVKLARTPEDLYKNKENGILSIMRGIENGYAIGNDLRNIERFARMGVVYITLCHNGDNNICDSARRSTAEHGGLSEFGYKVVKEMNRCGVMIDLSHAAESTFYDVLEASSTPIICSHSSSRAICNHPRNLSDDQLRELAKIDGVAQVTLYHGFLLSDEENRCATVNDAVRHLLHMIDIAGIDHVGIGTDFDGDGGVLGCSCASELINFTKRLIANGLTKDDLRKVWGGNFLRVMKCCQTAASISFYE